MTRSPKYVALDVHQATTVASVRAATRVHHPADRAQWLTQLPNCGARLRAEALYAELDVLRTLRPKVKAAMPAEARRNPASILMTTDINRWRSECRHLYRRLAGTAQLYPPEPNLYLKLQAVNRAGRLELRVAITPDHMTQEHVFKIELDQSYLPAILEQCERLLQAWPVRGTPAPGEQPGI